MAGPRRGTPAVLVATTALLGMALPPIPAPAGVRTSTAPAYTVRKAKVGRTWCTLAVPAAWKRTLLIYAHDYLPEDAVLGAPLNPDALAYRTLLDEGWMVTATSYRSTGTIPRQEAMEDIDALRAFVVREYGDPALTLVLGASGGADIVTSLAERKPSGYQGALAVGALASTADARADTPRFTFEPSIPLLFLSTSTGVDGPRSYVARARRARVVPIVWTVSRPGDLNINQQELLAALNGLIQWTGGTRIETSKDITAAAARSQSAEVTGRVLAVNRRFGNLMTSFTTEDMDRLGIAIGGAFTLVAGGKPFPIRYVTSFGDVGEGEWFAVAIRSGLGESQFEDNLTIGRNRADAAAASGADVGTMLAVRR
jgi:pimeloyl-ACP methyl ester carboxylesterase